MNRPLYETVKDRTREESVMRRIASACPSIQNYHKIENISYGVDYYCEAPDGPRVVEIKCRQRKIPFWLVAMHKVLTASRWESVGVPCWLCVHWEEDGSAYMARPCAPTGATPYTVEWNGRTKMKRGDKSDMEPHARFELKDMYAVG